MRVRVEDLGVRLGGRMVLREIGGSIEPGRVTVIVGPNASGKTTLLRTLVGALRPTTGSVDVDGRLAHRWSGRALARRIAFVAQRPSMAAPLSVRDVVAIGRHAIGRDDAAVERAMQSMDLLSVAERPWPALSAGQQHRVAIARMLAQRDGGPAGGMIVLDEPTASLDLRHAAVVEQVLTRLAGGGATVIVTMHDLARARAWADDAWVLADGRLVASGSADAALAPEPLGRAFGVPFRLAELDDRRVLVADLDAVEAVDAGAHLDAGADAASASTSASTPASDRR